MVIRPILGDAAAVEPGRKSRSGSGGCGSAIGRARAQRVAEPRARGLPVTFHRRGGLADRVRRLLDAEAAEITQLHHARLGRVDAIEPLQCRIKVDQVEVARSVVLEAVQGHALAAVALESRTLARVVDQDLAHQARRDREQVTAIGARDRIRARKPQPGLVDQSGGLQRVVPALGPEHLLGEPVQFGIQAFDEAIARAGIPVAPVRQQFGDALGHAAV